MSTDDVEDDEPEEVDELAVALGIDKLGQDEKPRFYCAGAKRTDPKTGKKLCNYKARHNWSTRGDGRCPKCRQLFACLPIRKTRPDAAQVTLGAQVMQAVKETEYHSVGVHELDQVLGGGVVYGTCLLVGGLRGGGKTTALLQACAGFARGNDRAFFASAEMTRDRILAYAKRFNVVNDQIALWADPSGIEVEELFDRVVHFGAKLVVVDSAQVCVVKGKKSDIGQPQMVDSVAQMMTSFAQDRKRAVLLIGHLVKAGDYGGTGQLQHLVDGLLRIDPILGPPDASGKPIDTMVRDISWDGKSRQSVGNIKARMELTQEGMRPLSVRALRELARLHIS